MFFGRWRRLCRQPVLWFLKYTYANKHRIVLYSQAQYQSIKSDAQQFLALDQKFWRDFCVCLSVIDSAWFWKTTFYWFGKAEGW